MSDAGNYCADSRFPHRAGVGYHRVCGGGGGGGGVRSAGANNPPWDSAEGWGGIPGGGGDPRACILHSGPYKLLCDRLPRGTALQSLIGFDVRLQASKTVV